MVKAVRPLTKPLVPSSGSTRKKAPVMLGDVAGGHGLLGDDGDPRGDPRQRFEDDLLRLPVGRGDGAVVGLPLNGNARVEVGHLHAGGGERHAQEVLGEASHVAGVHAGLALLSRAFVRVARLPEPMLREMGPSSDEKTILSCAVALCGSPALAAAARSVYQGSIDAQAFVSASVA